MNRCRKALRRVAAGIAMAAAVAWTGLAETVTNVRGMQREKSHLVDIYYDLEASDGGTYTVSVEIEGRTNEVTATTFSGDVGDGIAPGRNHHILWNAGADWPGKKGDVKAIVTATREPEKEKPGKGVQLWEGGPYWADMNIGASSPEDSGLYFWWGDTMGHRPSSDGTFGFNFDRDDAISGQTYDKTIDTLLSEGWIVSKDGTYVLAPAHDAAHVQWGGSWRIPTDQELDDLYYFMCDWTWTAMNGVGGYVVRGRGAYASKSIFLPCVGGGYGTSLYNFGWYGVYWSSGPGDPYGEIDGDERYPYVRYLYYDSGDQLSICYNRYQGFPIRPVQGFTE